MLQPRPLWRRRDVAEQDRPRLPFPVWHVVHRYQHHAGPSGYDRLSDYMGRQIRVGRALYLMGETVLRPWALYESKFGGQYEFSRYDWVLERALMLQMRSSADSVFHVLYGEKNLRSACRLAGRRGNRLIATLHHPPGRYADIFRSTKHLSLLSHAIVMTESLKELAEDLVGKARVSVVPYGVDTEYFIPADETSNSRLPTVAFAGFHLRDYDTLESVLKIVLSRHNRVRFVLVSKDERCRAMAGEHPGRVVQMERLTDEEYRSVLQTSDIMLLPLKESAAVTVALEAMSCGVPVVATDGGIRDYVGNGGGVLCAARDAEEMAGVIIRLLDDEDELRTLKASARARSQQFSWPRVARATADVYQSVVQQRL